MASKEQVPADVFAGNPGAPIGGVGVGVGDGVGEGEGVGLGVGDGAGEGAGLGDDDVRAMPKSR